MMCRVVGGCVLVVYLATLYGTYVPDWQFLVENTDSPDFGKILTVSSLKFPQKIIMMLKLLVFRYLAM